MTTRRRQIMNERICVENIENVKQDILNAVEVAFNERQEQSIQDE